MNLEELDQIIDRGMRAPLSESDGEKLKAALHAWQNEAAAEAADTEKTSAVLPPDPSSEPAAEKPSPEESASRRDMGAMAPPRLPAREPVRRRSTPRSTPATPARNAAWEKSTARKSRQRWCGSWGRRRWKRPCSRWSDCAATPAGRCSPRTNRQTAGAEKYDETAVAMIALLKYGTGVPFKRLERLEGQSGHAAAGSHAVGIVAATAALDPAGAVRS